MGYIVASVVFLLAFWMMINAIIYDVYSIVAQKGLKHLWMSGMYATICLAYLMFIYKW